MKNKKSIRVSDRCGIYGFSSLSSSPPLSEGHWGPSEVMEAPLILSVIATYWA